MTTAGIAATSPIAVASKASAMPGATTARLVVCACEMPMKAFMMPQTVPKRPTKGAVEPIVAKTPVPRDMRRAAAASMRDRREVTRSFSPSPDTWSSEPAESAVSSSAARTSRAPGPLLWPSARPAWFSVAALPIACAARRARSLPPRISSDLASHIVQVTKDAKASPIITAFTTMSAAMNMPHGDRSCGRVRDVAVEGPVSIGVVSVGVISAGVVSPGCIAGGTTASGAASAGAGAGAAIAGAAPGCSWAAVPPADRTTDASNAAIKPCLDKGFSLIPTATSLHIADGLAGDGVRKHANLDAENSFEHVANARLTMKHEFTSQQLKRLFESTKSRDAGFASKFETK
ncbi:hypothetical protein MES4922_420056 [Mesorhizobium ventifaucium]|uniref:Uncharacterized protein n=1 Tax=Mesorhizobium ventifaucium TaxID=666020 RepID=A0ABN8K6Z0_9HYPH|nr:hypothetical protein MES4922_420056 [Mesorhizobium ventifaucium]